MIDIAKGILGEEYQLVSKTSPELPKLNKEAYDYLVFLRKNFTLNNKLAIIKIICDATQCTLLEAKEVYEAIVCPNGYLLSRDNQFYKKFGAGILSGDDGADSTNALKKYTRIVYYKVNSSGSLVPDGWDVYEVVEDKL